MVVMFKWNLKNFVFPFTTWKSWVQWQSERQWLMMLAGSESRRCRSHLLSYHPLFAQRKALKCWKLNMFSTELEWNMTWIYFVLDSAFKHLILYPLLSIYKSLWSCFQNCKNLAIQSLIRVNCFFVFLLIGFILVGRP